MTAVSLPTPAPAADTTDNDLARWLAGVTLVAALIELVLLRLVSRTAIHIPGIEEVAGPYRLVAAAGRYTYYAATVLVTITLALLARRLLRQGHRGDATAIGVIIVASVAARLGLIDHTALAMATAASLVVLIVGIIGAHPRLGTPVGLFGAAFLVASVHAIAQDLSGSGDLQPRSTIALLVAAEALLFAAVLTLARAVPPTRHSDIVLGAAVAITVFGVLVASPATIKVLMLWTIGLPGYFPAAVYAIVAGLLTSTLRAALRDDRDLAVGLGLLMAGGIGLHNSYQTALVVCGLALLRLWAAEAPTPSLPSNRGARPFSSARHP